VTGWNDMWVTSAPLHRIQCTPCLEKKRPKCFYNIFYKTLGDFDEFNT